jgi:phasin family protein
LICINSQWLAATNSEGHSTNLKENVMSKDSKRTKKAMSADSKLLKKGTVSSDSKPAVKIAASDDSKPTEKTIASSDGKPADKSAASDESQLTEETTVANDVEPAEKGTASSDSKPADKSAASDESQLTEETTVPNDVKPAERGTAGGTPVFDFTKLMSQFPLPGVDFATLVDREQKNIEALTKANRIAFEGWQRLVRRQAEMLQETMQKVVADASQLDAKKRVDLAKEGFEKALANMRELAEITTQSQKEAFDVVSKRIEENMEGIRNPGKKASK